MIWHLFEVWLSLLATFIVGCVIGAFAYELIFRTSLVTAQDAVADSVGDAVDRIKDRIGIGPVWRSRRRLVEFDDREEPEEVLGEPAADVAGSMTGRRAVAAEPAGDAIETARPEGAEPGPAAKGETLRPDERSGPARPPARPRAAGASEPPAAREPTGPAGKPPVPADGIVPMRPASLAEPRNGVPDNLQRIMGIGERNERRLNDLGIFHFGQIASWTPAEVRWIGQHLAFPERIELDDWVGQAIVLASGGDTGFTKSAERRRARRQQALRPAYPEPEEADETP